MGWQEYAKNLDELATNIAKRHQQDGADAAAAQLMSSAYARIGQIARKTLDDEVLGRAVFDGGSATTLQALRDALTGEEGDTDGPA